MPGAIPISAGSVQALPASEKMAAKLQAMVSARQAQAGGPSGGAGGISGQVSGAAGGRVICGTVGGGSETGGSVPIGAPAGQGHHYMAQSSPFSFDSEGNVIDDKMLEALSTLTLETENHNKKQEDIQSS
jgi:hypothetical protein